MQPRLEYGGIPLAQDTGTNEYVAVSPFTGRLKEFSLSEGQQLDQHTKIILETGDGTVNLVAAPLLSLSLSLPAPASIEREQVKVTSSFGYRRDMPWMLAGTIANEFAHVSNAMRLIHIADCVACNIHGHSRHLLFRLDWLLHAAYIESSQKHTCLTACSKRIPLWISHSRDHGP